MTSRRSLAALLLMLALCFAPSFALATLACVTRCCPAESAWRSSETASAVPAKGSSATVSTERAEAGAAAAIGRADCCFSQVQPAAGLAPTIASLSAPSLAAPLALVPPTPARQTGADRASRHPARLAARTSPLRLSVVLLI